MERKVAETSPFTNPGILEQHSHYAHRLIDMVMDEWQPTSSQYEQLVTHLKECIHCQVALGMFVIVERNYDRSTGSPVVPAERLLSQITEIIHETTARDEIGAYIEMLEAKGEKKANKKFPRFVEHLKRCKACLSDVEEIRDLLHRAKGAGLIEPP
jgi:hypothetical protein